jgi:hypothetical protein
MALANLMRLSSLKAAHVAVGECHVAGDPGSPDFLLSGVALANLMRLSLLKAAHVAVGECHVAGNPGRPSFSAHVRWGEHGAPVQALLAAVVTQTLQGRNECSDCGQNDLTFKIFPCITNACGQFHPNLLLCSR